MANRVDSNVTGVSVAEETSLKVLPGVDGSTATWYDMEPNSYSDFGGDISMVSRQPIDPSRQNKKGTVTDVNASGGFNIDVTKNNLNRIMQGFFFADFREKVSTRPFNGTQDTITSVTASSKQYNATGGGLIDFNRAGFLVSATGYGIAANNGLKTVASATNNAVVVNETLVDEAAPPAAAQLQVVGYQFTAGDVNMALVGSVGSMTATTADFTTLGLTIGEWIFIGGDTATLRFTNNSGFARIATIAAKALTFDDVAFLGSVNATTESGSGKTVRIFFGNVLRNELLPSLIKRRSYNIERTLGINDTYGTTQAEYLEGAIANELTLNIPTGDKLAADISFVAMDNKHRSGAPGDVRKAGTHIAAAGEDAINTSSDVFRIKMSINDPTNSNTGALFGYVSEANITVNNNVNPLKAVGVLGSFDASFGNFDVSGSVTAYFTDVAAIRAIRANANVGLSAIIASKNAGQVWDMPLLALGGGRLNIEKDSPVTVPLDTSGAQNAAGYTLMYQTFPYLPQLAMPS